jgi:hypothetical protein
MHTASIIIIIIIIVLLLFSLLFFLLIAQPPSFHSSLCRLASSVCYSIENAQKCCWQHAKDTRRP